MDLRVKKGKATVRFQKNEVNAINTCLDNCKQLNNWLSDADAARVVENLSIVKARYVDPPKPMPLMDFAEQEAR